MNYKASFAPSDGEKKTVDGYKLKSSKSLKDHAKKLLRYAAVPCKLKDGYKDYAHTTEIYDWLRFDCDAPGEADAIVSILKEANASFILMPSTNYDPIKKPHKRQIWAVANGASNYVQGYKMQVYDLCSKLGIMIKPNEQRSLKDPKLVLSDVAVTERVSQNSNPYKHGKAPDEGLAFVEVHEGEALQFMEVDESDLIPNEEYKAKKGSINIEGLAEHKPIKTYDVPSGDGSRTVTLTDGSSTVMTTDGIATLRSIAEQLAPGEILSNTIGCIWHNEKHDHGYDHIGYGLVKKEADGNVFFECKGGHGCANRGKVFLDGALDGERVELSDKEALIVDEYKKKLKKVKKQLKSITPKKITKPFKIPTKVDKPKKYVKKIARVSDEIERDRYMTKLAKAVGATKTSIKNEVKKAMVPSPEYLKVSSTYNKLSKLVYEMRTKPPLDAVIAYEMSNVTGEAAINAKKKELAKKFNVDKSSIAKIHASASIDWNAIDKAIGGKVYWELKQGRFFVHKNNNGIEYLGKTEQFKQTLRSKTRTSDKDALDLILARIPAANIVYDPTHTIDVQAGYVNAHVKIDLGEGDASMPPIVKAALDNVFKYQMEDQEHFINWMAYIMQTGKRSGVAWAFYGEQGAGKGLLVDAFSYALGVMNCALNVGNDSVEADFTDYVMHKSLLQLNEVALGKGQRRAISGKIKAFITDPTLNIRLKGLSDVQVDNHLNLILNSNNNAPIEIETTDRRWNVVKTGEPKRFEEDFGRQAISEIGKQLGRYLMQYEVDEVAATRILPKNEAKRAIERRTNSRLYLMLNAIAEWNLDEFLKVSHYEEIDEFEIGIPSKKELKKAFVQRKCKVKWLHDICLAIGVFEKHENQTYMGIRIKEALPDSLKKVRRKDAYYLIQK